MNRIYIARHGETIWNVEGRIQGRSDPELSPRGIEQSLVLLELLKDRPLLAIYTSTLKRSILTAQPISHYFGLPIRQRPELDEMAFGILEGKRVLCLDDGMREEWERFKRERFTYRLPQGENYTDVIYRVQPFIEEILRNHRDQEILIVGHRVVNLMLLALLLRYPLEEISKVQQDNGGLYLVEKDGEVKVYHHHDGRMMEGLRIGRDIRVL